MRRLWPDSLPGQTLLILLAGLLLSHAAGAWFYAADRQEAVRAIGGYAAAQRIANLARLVVETPAEQRPRLVAALSDDRFRIALEQAPPAAGVAQAPGAEAVADFIVAELGLPAEWRPRVILSALSGSADAAPVAGGPRHGDHARAGSRGGHGRGFGREAGDRDAGGRGMGGMGMGGRMAGPEPMMHGFGGLGSMRRLTVAIPMAGGPWLVFATGLPEGGSGYSTQFLVSMAIMAAIIAVVTLLAARRMTTPLATLARAAERFGRDMNAPPLPETGTRETRQAARAFNAMQGRLRSLIENRTRLLAAISHDLRTPLTLLRLRAETVADAAERERMISTIDEMDGLIGATLAFARDEARSEPRRVADVTALAQSAVDDLADAGQDVTMAPGAAVVCECQPAALKRALGNLLDNAIKYGGAATVSVSGGPAEVIVAIEDKGPGIPQDALERVFEPFYRVDDSRSRETGGVGLGLAIARSLVQAMGGELVLENRPEGGLRAAIRLPR